MHLTARRLFDGCSGDVLLDHALRIEDGAIVAVLPRRDVPDGAEVVDLGDATLLPGLVDAHQHLGFDCSRDPVVQLGIDDDATHFARMEQAAQRALAVGITTIRDLGDRDYASLALRDRFAVGDTVGPRILAAGPPITSKQGHCWFLGGEAEGVDGVLAAVREHVGRGVDVIKVMASGGNLTPTVGPHESQFGAAELAVALEQAHAAGRKLAVHAHGVQAIVDSLAVGVDSIEHCTLFTADSVSSDPELIAAIAAGPCVISVTASSLPSEPVSVPAIAKRLEAMTANFAALHAAGARLVCSSDAGVAPAKPHSVLPYGVSDFLPRIGMSNVEAILATTARAAEACGIDHLTGTLEVGKAADVLAVAGDPLTDIGAIHDVVAVFTSGRRFV